MPVLVWNKPGERVYESGLDRGVLYLPDGSAVPWNGLTSIVEAFDNDASPVYYDGMKVQDMVVLGDFSATMKAVTYPEEFVELEGIGELRRGLFLSDQAPLTFGLAYRTLIGDDVAGPDAAYKIHLLYNVTAIPSDKTYASISDQPSLVEFEWSITAVPEDIPGFRPTAHIVLDSRNLDPWLLEDLEAMLYGSTVADAVLLPMPDMFAFLNNWYRVKIIDNGDGTWTAIADRDGVIQLSEANSYFTITGANAIYLDDVTYVIDDTTDISQVQQIEITDVGNGTWTASTEQDNVITMLDPDTFEIKNANVVWIDADTYQITDTTSED